MSGRQDQFRRTEFRNPEGDGVEGRGAVTKVEQDRFTWSDAQSAGPHSVICAAAYGAAVDGAGPAEGLGVALGPRYISSAPVNHFNYYFLGGYTLWDTAVYYRTKRIDYSVNVSNLFNKERYLLASINDFLVYPGRPLDVSANLRFKW